jgi:hypothetical protein
MQHACVDVNTVKMLVGKSVGQDMLSMFERSGASQSLYQIRERLRLRRNKCAKHEKK